MKKILIALVSFFGALIIFSGNVQALTFDLVPPAGQLQQGQNVQFTVNINTEGKSYATTSIGMTYDATLLQYVSTAPGTTFGTVTTDNQSGGKLVLTGTSAAGFTGSGSFALVTFKIIATSSGSTTLCTLFNPDTPTPTTVAGPTATPGPTALPKTGSFDQTKNGLLLGAGFFVLSALSFFIIKKI